MTGDEGSLLRNGHGLTHDLNDTATRVTTPATL